MPCETQPAPSRNGFSPGIRGGLILPAVGALGFSAAMTQLILLRELLSAFGGNEIIFGIILGNWLLLTGIGTGLGRTGSRLRHPLRFLAGGQILLAVIPFTQLLAVRLLWNVVFIRGSQVGVAESWIFCFLLLLPYCLLSGYLLTLACTLPVRQTEEAGLGRVYFMDNIGSLIGGAILSFFLIYRFDHVGILYLPSCLNLVLGCALGWRAGRKSLFTGWTAAAGGVLLLISVVNLPAGATRVQYAGQEVVFEKHSPYGRLVVTRQAGQYNFIENGVPLFSTNNVEQVEEAIHYAMAQRPHAAQVLLVGGGISGTAQEILKYPVRAVDYVELDPMILAAGRRYVPGNLADPRIRVIATDGRRFVKSTDRRYDVLINDVPDPASLQINRFYTLEYFTEAKAILARDGVLSVSLGHYENYLSPELARLIGITHGTLKQVFRNVLILPGARVVFLASDGPLYLDVAGQLKRFQIKTRWVTPAYLQATLTPDRIADIHRAVSVSGKINRDFNPKLYYYHLRHWLGQLKVRYGLLLVLLGLGFGSYCLRLRAVPWAVFATGFAASVLTLVLLMGFQILYGGVYHQVSLIVTMFMAGLAAGSFYINRTVTTRQRTDLVKLLVALAVYAGLLPLALIHLGRVNPAYSSGVVWLVFPLMTVVLGGLAGMVFPLAGRVDFQTTARTAGRLYLADFAGSCLGALLVSTLLIPLIGVFHVCLLVAGFCILSGLVLRFTGRG